jgi:hypothetical protein
VQVILIIEGSAIVVCRMSGTAINPSMKPPDIEAAIKPKSIAMPLVTA